MVESVPQLILSDLDALARARGISIYTGSHPRSVNLSYGGTFRVLSLTHQGCIAPRCLTPVTRERSYDNCPITVHITRDGVCVVGPASENSAEIRETSFAALAEAGMPPWIKLTLARPDRTSRAEVVDLTTVINLEEIYSTSPQNGKRLLTSMLWSFFPEVGVDRFFAPPHMPIGPSSPAGLGAINRIRAARYPDRFFYKPVALDLEITHRCTLECTECAIIDDVRRGHGGLPLPILTKLFTEAEELGMYTYSITGGEPFIRFHDMCDLIASTSMDCYKIQTNATYFSTPQKTEDMVAKLYRSGFGKKNRYVTATLQCSVGIQNYEGGCNSNHAVNAARAMQPYLNENASNSAAFALSVTLDASADPVAELMNWRRDLSEFADISWESDRAHIRIIPINKSYHLADDESAPRRMLRELVQERSAMWGSCFYSDTLPWPRLLVRATGEVYACSCFGHVFSLGFFPERSLAELVAIANQIQQFKAVHDHGVAGVFERMDEGQKKRLGELHVSESMTLCQMCGIINTESAKAAPALVKIGAAQSN